MIAPLITLLAISPAQAQDCPDIDAFIIQELYRSEYSPAIYGTLEDENPNWDPFSPDKNLISIPDPPVAETRMFRLTESTEVPTSALPGSCGCQWQINSSDWSEQIKGTLESDETAPGVSAVGSVVTYTPPEDLLDCLDEEVFIEVSCSGMDAVSFSLVVTPPDPDGDNSGEPAPQYTRPCSVSGGGCTSPQSMGSTDRSAPALPSETEPDQATGWLLFPLLGLGVMVRRRS